MSEKARALVLRTSDFSETSLIATLLTDRLGLLRTIAKGALRPGSQLYGGLGIFSLSRVTVYPRKKGLSVLGEADLEQGFPAIGESLESYYQAHYAAELLLGMNAEADPCPEVFALAETAFRRLASGPEGPAALFAFEAGLLRLAGHMPRTGACVGCGAALSARGRVLFSPLDGGALCEACAPAAADQAFPVRGGTLALVARFADPSGPPAGNVRVPRPTAREMRRVFAASFRAVMERDLRTLRYVGGG